jgi:hypothetical protein
MKDLQRDRILYEDLIKIFPPPPYLFQSEIRPWLYQEICRTSQEHPGRFSWFIAQMQNLKWEKR